MQRILTEISANLIAKPFHISNADITPNIFFFFFNSHHTHTFNLLSVFQIVLFINLIQHAKMQNVQVEILLNLIPRPLHICYGPHHIDTTGHQDRSTWDLWKGPLIMEANFCHHQHPYKVPPPPPSIICIFQFQIAPILQFNAIHWSAKWPNWNNSELDTQTTSHLLRITSHWHYRASGQIHLGLMKRAFNYGGKLLSPSTSI